MPVHGMGTTTRNQVNVLLKWLNIYWKMEARYHTMFYTKLNLNKVMRFGNRWGIHIIVMNTKISD